MRRTAKRNQTHWRQLAMEGQWEGIDPILLNHHARDELHRLLYDQLPKSAQGSGMETYSRVILPEQARTKQDYFGAQLFHYLSNRSSGYENPFQDEVTMAIAIFEDTGWEFHGCRRTFFYQDNQGEWFQLETEFALAIQERYWEKVFELSVEEYRAWIRKYPWRNPISLTKFHEYQSDTHTEFWHAVNILYWYDEYRQHFPDMPPAYHEHKGSGVSKKERLEMLYTGATCGKHIGSSAKAIELKRYENHAARGIKVSAGSRLGGRMAAAATYNDTSERLDEMDRLLSEGKTTSDAARIAARRVGGTAEGNRKLLQRRRRN